MMPQADSTVEAQNPSGFLSSRDRFLSAVRRLPLERPPVWFMRQAGRYLPEYRQLKARHGFLDLVRTPELAVEVTLQPLRRYPLDAAILFSDILVIPEAIGIGYSFREGGGIEMAGRIESAADVARLDTSAIGERLGYVFETLRLLRRELDSRQALLGFCGSPWTLAAYMVEGGSSESFSRLLTLAHREPAILEALLEKISDAVVDYVRLQAAAGADAVQIFDSWAGLCPGAHYEGWSLRWIRRIIQALPAGFPVILFARGAGAHLERIVNTGAQVVSADTSIDLAEAMRRFPKVAWQGNLDPSIVELEPEIASLAMRELLQAVGGSPGHIVNLGHGLRPAARPESVGAAIQAVLDHRIPVA